MYLHSFTPVNESACFSNESLCSSNKIQFPPTASLMTVITLPLQKKTSYNTLWNVALLCVCVCTHTVTKMIHNPSSRSKYWPRRGEIKNVMCIIYRSPWNTHTETQTHNEAFFLFSCHTIYYILVFFSPLLGLRDEEFSAQTDTDTFSRREQVRACQTSA